ncbi:MAG: 16S rRNA (cytosine(1402)-N(4))-methyltransferase RsmH [Pirellulales bacterium]|nr:16S rRNA (cytosine(1402)-N(4))-methyltransferase RsmH [Pirellulales bacterium]
MTRRGAPSTCSTGDASDPTSELHAFSVKNIDRRAFGRLLVRRGRPSFTLASDLPLRNRIATLGHVRHNPPPLFVRAGSGARSPASHHPVVGPVLVNAPRHVPVLLDEILAALDPQPGGVFVDGTLGGGGYTRAIAERVGNRGDVIALDRDPAAIAAAEINLKGLPVKLVQSNFCDLPEVLDQLEIATVDGVVLDLGLSSDQLADVERGFSFDATGPLDLRFDPMEGEPASRLVNRLKAEHLADLIFAYGEERYSRRIARAIVARREERPIETAQDLASIVRRAVPRTRDSERIDPATRTFQALRIAVNEELKSLEIALRRIPDRLRAGGKFVVVSFHSLEDRRVKEAFRNDPRLEIDSRRAAQATEEEIRRNPRSRSAKLRAARRR